MPCYNELHHRRAGHQARARPAVRGRADRRRRRLHRRHARRPGDAVGARACESCSRSGTRARVPPCARASAWPPRRSWPSRTPTSSTTPPTSNGCLRPLLEGHADVVYGSRFLTSDAHRVLYYWHSLGNRALTTLSNMVTNLNLTDMETCYKVFRREVLEQIVIEEDRFGVEPELTAKVAALGCRIFEVGISYNGRSYAEGKKIGWRDGVRAVVCIGKYSAKAKSGAAPGPCPPAGRLRGGRRRAGQHAPLTRWRGELRRVAGLDDPTAPSRPHPRGRRGPRHLLRAPRRTWRADGQRAERAGGRAAP